MPATVRRVSGVWPWRMQQRGLARPSNGTPLPSTAYYQTPYGRFRRVTGKLATLSTEHGYHCELASQYSVEQAAPIAR